MGDVSGYLHVVAGTAEAGPVDFSADFDALADGCSTIFPAYSQALHYRRFHHQLFIGCQRRGMRSPAAATATQLP